MGRLAIGYNTIPIDKLKKADWNYKKEDETLSKKLLNNIKKNGQIENLIVRELDSDVYEVINGNHRLDVLKVLGYKEVLVYNCGKISEQQAKRIAIETNEIKFPNDSLKFIELIKELTEVDTIEDLTTTLPYSENDINFYIDLVDFSINDAFNNIDLSNIYETNSTEQIIEDEDGDCIICPYCGGKN